MHHQQGWYSPAEQLSGLEPGIGAAIKPGETENRRSASWLGGTHRSRPASAGTIRSHMFVCGVCARGTSHCDNGLLSMSAVVEPSTRSPLCSLCLLEVHTQPLSWPELGMWNVTFTELLESATHEPFGWSLCAWLSSFSAVFWVWLRIVQGRFWIYLTCPLGSLQISVQKKFIC